MRSRLVPLLLISMMALAPGCDSIRAEGSGPVPVPGGEAKSSTPMEQYKAMVKEYYEAARANWEAATDEQRAKAGARVVPLPLRMLELAEKHPADPIVLDALIQVVSFEYWLDNYSTHRGWGKDSRQAKAMAIMLRDHLASDKLDEACRRVQSGFRKECETFLRTVLEKSPHKIVQARACLRLAQFLNSRLNKIDLLTDQPDLAKRYELLFGKEYLDSLKRQDRAKALQEIEVIFELAIEKYADVELPFGGTVGEQAKTELFEIRHLTVGKPALEIDGVDQDGKRFKLSDYRGKVVLLYFWSEY